MYMLTGSVLEGSERKLSNSKSSQVSRILLRNLAVRNNAVVWIFTARIPIFNSSRPLNKSFGISPSKRITTAITVTFIFHSLFFFLFLTRSKLFFSLSSFFDFLSVVCRTTKSTS